MSESRQPGDQKRFTLSSTADGPRFVLATNKEAAPASDAPPAAQASPAPQTEGAAEAVASTAHDRAAEAPVTPTPVPAAPRAAAPEAAPRTPKLPPLPPQKGSATRTDNGKRKAKNGRHEPYVSKAKRAEIAATSESVTPAASTPVVPTPAPHVATTPAAPAASTPAAPAASKPSAPAASKPAASTPAAPAASKPDLRPASQEAPTQTHTVLDAESNDRLPTAFWKAALPPQAEAVAADYTVDAGVERVHAPVATPEEAIGMLKDAASPIPDPSRAPAFLSEQIARASRVRVPRVVIAALVLLLFGATLMVRLLPEPASQNVLTTRTERAPMGRARLAQSNGSRLFARGLDGALQKALESGLYVVVARKEDGTMSNEAIVEDLMTRDLESAQKLARIKSEALSQPLFIIARRNGEVAVVERINPGDRQAWRDYSMSVWYLKQHALSWSRDRYMSREALDSKQTLTVMSDFVRSHPDSRVVGSALEDIRYVCYYNLQDPAKFRDVALGLLDESLNAYDRQRNGNVPELVYVMKPYLKEAMNQFLYQRIHRITSEQAALEPVETGDLGSFTGL